ncbi:MAG TPA: pyridoxal-phosphate dependent enzyme [Vicinamibacterales bacterium]|nr:pyridoxal-phosphate dependent enzyme [Vicinamibacterales bacterium]
MPADRAALERLHAIPRLPLPWSPPAIEDLARLARTLGVDASLVVKRDDAIPIGFGGNKIRKLQIVAAQALAAGCDTLITTGGVQSNHARATAAIAARLGLRCVLVANGTPQDRPTGNALLDRLLGAEIRYVASREARVPAMEQAAGELRAGGRHPFVIPLGASTAHGAAAYALAIAELLTQMPAPDTIVLATSSGGTQAGIVAGCALHGLATRVIGISADDPAAAIAAEIRRILADLERLIGVSAGRLANARLEIDDGFVGAGYGVPTAESTAAIEACARSEALFLDPTYTAKAMAGLIARARRGELARGITLFWHTGGQVGLFA